MLARFLPNADLAFGVLGTELWSSSGLSFAAKAMRRFGRVGVADFTGAVLQTSRAWLRESFASERAHGLLAPWVLHTGLGPDAATSGFMTQVIAVAVQDGGMPIPRGGGAKLADALVQLIRDNGGTCETGVDVERVVVQSGRATGVLTSAGDSVTASRAVIANVTPTQLYERLLGESDVPAPVREGARRFRYGRAAMQIHFALSQPARWTGDERLNRTAVVHVTPGLDGVSRAVNEAERGLLPAEATIVVGQPLTIDPSRAPEGKGILWVQLQELPWQVRGDAAGDLDVGEGIWSERLRERYANRIQARLARHIPNLESSLLDRVVLSPADLERQNVNLRHGDPYGGALSLDQNFLWRPFPRSPGHGTPVERLWHIGASTWPGPGLGSGSGTLVARQLLKPPASQRALAKIRAARCQTPRSGVYPRCSLTPRQIREGSRAIRRRPPAPVKDPRRRSDRFGRPACCSCSSASRQGERTARLRPDSAQRSGTWSAAARRRAPASTHNATRMRGRAVGSAR